jgi:anti-sigma-K factor RsiG
MGEPASRTDRVLDPRFSEELDKLSLGELRERRDLALAEREFASYMRRLIQVRQDIVRAERDRRVRGEEPGSFIEDLTAILSEGPRRGPARGEALPLGPSAEDMDEAERRADAATGGVPLTDLQGVPDAELDRALEALTQEEHAVSASRAGILRVHDRFLEEIKRRYREDPSLIPTSI